MVIKPLCPITGIATQTKSFADDGRPYDQSKVLCPALCPLHNTDECTNCEDRNLIMEFYLGSDNSSGIKTTSEVDFMVYIQEAIREARYKGHKTFELEITSK